MTDFYVYLHLRGDNGNPFYVGKGKGNRAFIPRGRNKYWKRIVNKHGYTVDILWSGLSELEALEEERNVISELRYFGYKLCNLTDGCDGGCAYNRQPLSEETRTLMSKSHTGVKLSTSHVSAIKSVWTEDKRKLFGMQRLGPNSTTHDTKIYTFENLSGQVFTGKRVELCEKFNIKPSILKALFRKTRKRKTAAGWRLRLDNE